MSGDQTSQACAEIDAWIDAELGRKEVGSANRMSSAPQCVVKRWFQNQGMPGEVMGPRAIRVFASGDVTEHAFKYFISKACVGPGKLYSEVDFGKKTGSFIIQHREFDIHEQETVIADLGGMLIPGHADGWGKRNSDGRWELIEIKSSATIGFDKFVAGECEYIPQVHMLMMSDKARKLNVESARFFFWNKNNSAIFDRLYYYDEEIAAKTRLDFLAAAGPTKPKIPPEYYPEEETYYKKPTGRYKLGWKCGYCPYNKECWPSATLEFKGGKPVYYIEKKKESVG